MNDSSFNFARWQAPHFRPINKFYKSQKHKGKANGDDVVFYGFWLDDDQTEQIMGAVRLVPYLEDSEHPFYWLRSLYIREDLRGRSLGGALLAHTHQATSAPIYCFPYTHLESFYQSNGYALINVETLPESLQDLYIKYQQRGEKIIAMAKVP